MVAAKPLKVRPWFGDSEPLALDHAEALTKGDVVQNAEADGHHRVVDE